MGQHISGQQQIIPKQDPLTNRFNPPSFPSYRTAPSFRSSPATITTAHSRVTSDGKLLTWGKFSESALGLGDPVDMELGQSGGFATEEAWLHAIMDRRMNPPPDVAKPTEVRFDYQDKRKRPKYCLAAAAHGWHTGALVVDLDVSARISLSDHYHCNVCHMIQPDEEGDDAVLE